MMERAKHVPRFCAKPSSSSSRGLGNLRTQSTFRRQSLYSTRTSIQDQILHPRLSDPRKARICLPPIHPFHPVIFPFPITVRRKRLYYSFRVLSGFSTRLMGSTSGKYMCEYGVLDDDMSYITGNAFFFPCIFHSRCLFR